MPVITNETLSGKHIVITVEAYGKKNGQKYVVCYESREDLLGVKTGKIADPEGTPALGGATRPPSTFDIMLNREEHMNGRFSLHAQAVRPQKGEPGKLFVNEMLRSLSTSEVIEVELVDIDKIVY